MKLPCKYKDLTPQQRRNVREQYTLLQNGKCMWCEGLLNEKAPREIRNKKVNWKYFPPNFLKYPIHLQHCHRTGMTEGVVHAYCNAVMWQYHQR